MVADGGCVAKQRPTTTPMPADRRMPRGSPAARATAAPPAGVVLGAFLTRPAGGVFRHPPAAFSRPPRRDAVRPTTTPRFHPTRESSFVPSPPPPHHGRVSPVLHARSSSPLTLPICVGLVRCAAAVVRSWMRCGGAHQGHIHSHGRSVGHHLDWAPSL